jgi:hypothetical protein
MAASSRSRARRSSLRYQTRRQSWIGASHRGESPLAEARASRGGRSSPSRAPSELDQDSLPGRLPASRGRISSASARSVIGRIYSIQKMSPPIMWGLKAEDRPVRSPRHSIIPGATAAEAPGSEEVIPPRHPLSLLLPQTSPSVSRHDSPVAQPQRCFSRYRRRKAKKRSSPISRRRTSIIHAPFPYTMAA